MSSPVVREREYIAVSAFQDLDIDLDLLGEFPCNNPTDVVPIVFKLGYRVRSGLIDDEDDEEPTDWEIEENDLQFEVIRDVGLSRLKQTSPTSRGELRERFIDILSTKFQVPEENYQTIIDKIFEGVDSNSISIPPFRPFRPIKVNVTYVIVRLRLRPRPPPDGFLGLLYSEDDTDYGEEDLEEVGRDSLEAKRQETCSICMNDFEAKEEAAPIGRLPSCFHVFHRHCILRWLHKNPNCPLCRCPSHKKRKLEEILSSSTPTGPPSNIPRLTS